MNLIHVATVLVIAALTRSPAAGQAPPARDYAAAAAAMQQDQALQRVEATARSRDRQQQVQQRLITERAAELQSMAENRRVSETRERQRLEEQRRLDQQFQVVKSSADRDRRLLQSVSAATLAGMRRTRETLVKMLESLEKDLDESPSDTHEPPPKIDSQPQSKRSLPAKTKASDGNSTKAGKVGSVNSAEAGPIATLFSESASSKCDDILKELEDALFRNKRTETPSGGMHGLTHRRRELVDGRNGPGTPEWQGHVEAFENLQAHIRDLLHEFATNGCGDPPKGAWNIATEAAPRSQDWRGPALLTQSDPACQLMAGILAVSSAIAACTSEGSVAALACMPLAEVPVVPMGCAVAGCWHGAVVSGTATFAITERLCTLWKAQQKK